MKLQADDQQPNPEPTPAGEHTRDEATHSYQGGDRERGRASVERGRREHEQTHSHQHGHGRQEHGQAGGHGHNDADQEHGQGGQEFGQGGQEPGRPGDEHSQGDQDHGRHGVEHGRHEREHTHSQQRGRGSQEQGRGGEHGRGHHGERGEHGHRNFWHEWRDERHYRGDGESEFPVGQALSPKEMVAWREFFHKSFGNWPEEHWLVGGRRFSPWHQGLESFNPFVANLLSKGGGLLPLYVLHLVAQKPRYGNEIMELLAQRTNGQWVANPGAIYPLLSLLEQEGFINGEWEDPDKRTIRIYTITAAGQEEVLRIEALIAPKIEETVQVLQALLADLQNPPAATEL
jgi:PadR family transcriptional regulator, regulatory protein PadR